MELPLTLGGREVYHQGRDITAKPNAAADRSPASLTAIPLYLYVRAPSDSRPSGPDLR